MLLIVFLLVFTLLVIFYYKDKYKYWEKKNVPYEKPVLFFGNLLNTITLKESVSDFIKHVYEKFDKPYVGVYFLAKPALIVKDPELLKHILIKDFNFFTDRITTIVENVDPIGENVLFNAKSPHWNNLRRKVTPIFSSGKLKQMHLHIQNCTNDLMEYLKTTNNIIETKEIMSKFSTDVITSTCFGINANCFKDEKSEFWYISRRLVNWKSWRVSMPMMCYMFAPFLVKLFKIQLLDTYCTSFLNKVFATTMNDRINSNSKRNDLLDIILEIRKFEKIDDACTFDEVKSLAQAIQFFVAGFETTSLTATFCLFELAKVPQTQEKLIEEIKETVKKYGDLNYEVLHGMKYLDMCINETLRKYPIAPFLNRRCMEDYKLPGADIIIEKGTSLFVPVLGLHFDPKYFPEPHRFNPERFANEAPSPFTYLPFGDGPRNCIGARFASLTIKTALANIFLKYRVKLCEKSQVEIKMERKGVLLTPLGGIYLKLEEQ